jgi:hypothetical protein
MTLALRKTTPDETKLISCLLHRRMITESQLKACLDYQRSVGGRFSDVLLRMNILRASQLEELMQHLDSDEAEHGPSAVDDNVLDPASIKLSDLKVHRRLLDKLPKDLVEEYQLALFFPVPGANSRMIILGHGREIHPEIREKVKSIVGVEICSLALSGSMVRRFSPGKAQRQEPVSGENRKATALQPPSSDPCLDTKIDATVLPASPAHEAPAAFEAPPAPEATCHTCLENEILLNACLNLLSKKGLVTRAELEVELELCKVRKQARGSDG